MERLYFFKIQRLFKKSEVVFTKGEIDNEGNVKFLQNIVLSIQTLIPECDLLVVAPLKIFLCVFFFSAKNCLEDF